MGLEGPRGRFQICRITAWLCTLFEEVRGLGLCKSGTARAKGFVVAFFSTSSAAITAEGQGRKTNGDWWKLMLSSKMSLDERRSNKDLQVSI